MWTRTIFVFFQQQFVVLQQKKDLMNVQQVRNQMWYLETFIKCFIFMLKCDISCTYAQNELLRNYFQAWKCCNFAKVTQRVGDFPSYPMFLSDCWPYDHLFQLSSLFLNRHFGTCLCSVNQNTCLKLFRCWSVMNLGTWIQGICLLFSSMRQGNSLELAAVDQANYDPFCYRCIIICATQFVGNPCQSMTVFFLHSWIHLLRENRT